MRTIPPGQSVLAASFATRGSRVQIPSAPLKVLVKAISDRTSPRQMALLWCSRSTDGPQDSHCGPLISCEGVITESPSMHSGNWVALTFVED
jgi:hypothetical protein